MVELESAGEITRHLRLMRTGDNSARNRLFEIVYNELRRMAGRYMAGERSGHILQPTALVSEAYLRLVDQNVADLNDRIHFFAIAANIMRQVLVDYARAIRAQKRGGGVRHVTLVDVYAFSEQHPEELLALDAALEKMKEIMPRQSRVVELRFFAGLTFQQVGQLLGITDRTAKRDWEMARRWLDGEINGWIARAGAMGEGK
jgi:RNA polymerase sigma-70 factor, ECF subfamily